MATIADEFVSVFTADTRGLDAGVDAAKAKIATLSDSLDKASSAIGSFALGAIAQFTAIGGAALAAASDVNSAFRIIRVGTGETGADLASLKESFKTLFSSIPVGAKEVATALTTLTQLTGATGNALEELARQQLELAHITGSELKPQIDATTKAFNNFGIGARDQGAALDTLFRVSQLTGVGVTELAQSITQGGAAARTAGFSFETAALLVGQLNKVGIDSASVFQGFNIAFRKIAQKDPGADPAAVLQAIIEKIKGAGSAAEVNKVAVEAFGRSGIQMGEAIKSGRLNIEDLTRALANNHDSIGKATDETRTFGDSMKILKNQVELALQPLGAGMVGVFKSFLPQIQGAISALTDLSNAFKELEPQNQKLIASFVGIVGIVGPVGLGISKISGLFIGLGAAGGPIALAIAAIVALAVAYANNLGGMKDSVDKFVKASIEAWQDHGNELGKIAHATWDTQIQMFKAAANSIAGIMDGLTAAIKGKWMSAIHFIISNPITGGGVGMVGDALFGGGGPQEPLVVPTPTGSGAGSSGLPPVKKLPSVGVPNLGGARKAGGDIAKALIDGFQDGIQGLDAAIAKIGSGAGLDQLFDPISKKAKAGGEVTKAALETIAKDINEFLKASGANATVTIANLAANYSKFTDLIGRTESFEKVKDALAQINTDRAVAGLETLDTTLTVNNGHLQLSADALLALAAANPPLVDAINKTGMSFEATFPKIADTAKTVGLILKDITEKNKDYLTGIAVITDEKLAAATNSWKAFIQSLPVEQLKAQMQEIKAAIEITLTPLKTELEIKETIDGAIQQIERYGAEILHLTGGALQEWVTKQAQVMLVDLPNVTKEGLGRALDEHRKAAVQLPGIWNDVFKNMTAGAKEWAGAIFGVLDTIPGAFGQTVKKVTSTIEQWMKFFDSILGLLHKFSAAIPSGIGDALGGLFKTINSGTKASSSAWEAMENAMQGGADKMTNVTKNMGDSLKGVLGDVGAAMAGFATGIGVSMATGSKAIGAFAGAAMGALQGFLMGGPIGAIIGGVGGLIGGLFGGGKSAAQKQQEALQLQQLKDQIAQDAQSIVNSALDGFNKALDFLNKLDGFTAARKENFRAFFRQLTKLMDWFVELSKAWGKDTLDKAKAFADTLGPIVDAIANAPAALEAIGQYIPAASFAIDAFFNDLQRVVMKFGELADSIANDFQKRARKFAERVLPVTDVIKSAVEGLAGIMNFAEVPKEAMDLFGDALKMAVLKMTEIADQLDQSGVKAAARFADRAGVITGLLKSGVEGLLALATLTPIAPAAFDIFFDGIKMALSRMSDLAQSLDTDMLSRAVGIANAIIPISAAIKAWAEAANAVRDYTAIAESVWQSIADDLQRTFHLLDMMLASAIDYIPVAMKLEDVMSQIAQHLKGALTAMGTGLQSAASAFGAMVGAIEGGVPLGGPSLGGSTFGAQSVRTSGSSAPGAIYGPTSVTVHVYPTPGMDEQTVARLVVTEIGKRAQRFKTQVQMA